MESKHECFILYFLGNVMRGWGMCYQGIRVASSYPLIQANGPIQEPIWWAPDQFPCNKIQT